MLSHPGPHREPHLDQQLDICLGQQDSYGDRMSACSNKLEKMNEHVLCRWAFIKLSLYYLGLGKKQAFFESKQSLSWLFKGLYWALPLINLFPGSPGVCCLLYISIIFPGDSTTLCYHFDFDPKFCLLIWFLLHRCLSLPAPSCFLLHISQAKEFPLLFSPALLILDNG